MKDGKTSFQAFLEYFPKVDLPFLIAEDAHHGFSSENAPLPLPMIREHILDRDVSEEGDTFDEYIPCFQLPDTDAFFAVVYFKVTLLVYEYYLKTYDEKGNPIAEEKIGGMLTEGEKIHRAVTTIEKDWIIHIVEGAAPLDSEVYQPTNSKAYAMEILPDGQIIFVVNEDII